jgi:hypothetical protein
MDKKRISDVLRSLASGEKNRSETARLREVFDEVEAALSAGVRRTAIVEALQGQGFTMGLNTFDSALYRIRKRNKALQESSGKQVLKQPPAKPENASSTPTPEPVTAAATPPVGSHNPDDITKIMSAYVDLDALSKIAKRKK